MVRTFAGAIGHLGEHPYQWCREEIEKRWQRLKELEMQVAALRAEVQTDTFGPRLAPGT